MLGTSVPGFSLFEMMIVLMMLAAILFWCAPLFSAQDLQHIAFGRELAEFLEHSRAYALEHHAMVRVSPSLSRPKEISNWNQDWVAEDLQKNRVIDILQHPGPGYQLRMQYFGQNPYLDFLPGADIVSRNGHIELCSKVKCVHWQFNRAGHLSQPL